MRSAYTQLFIHFIWATWNRQELIDPNLEPILYKLVSDILLKQKCQLINIGGTANHIHILVDIHPTTCISDLVKYIKGYSSFSIANQIRPDSFFKWQGGYGAITVSPHAIPTLSKYIVNQKEHHDGKLIDQRWELDLR